MWKLTLSMSLNNNMYNDLQIQYLRAKMFVYDIEKQYHTSMLFFHQRLCPKSQTLK